MNVSQNDFIELMREEGAFLEGHFQLASGRHAGMYVNKNALYPNVELIGLFCARMADLALDLAPTLVVGPEKGGIILSVLVATDLSTPSHPVKSIFAEKDLDKEGKEIFVFKRDYDKFVPGSRAIIVEDVLTTGGSVKKAVKAVRDLGGEVAGVIALFNRGNVSAGSIGVPVLKSLVNLEIPSWTPGECPLCNQGVKIGTNVGHGAS